MVLICSNVSRNSNTKEQNLERHKINNDFHVHSELGQSWMGSPIESNPLVFWYGIMMNQLRIWSQNLGGFELEEARPFQQTTLLWKSLEEEVSI